jgi:hypothetical protein
MKHFHENSNQPDDGSPGMTDEQLDNLLFLAQAPKIDSPRKRRLKKHLTSLLHSNAGVFSLDVTWTRVATGAVALCGLAFLVFSFGQFEDHAELVSHSIENSPIATNTAKNTPPKFAPIVSYVAWTPRTHEATRRPRKRFVSSFLGSQQVQVQNAVTEFFDSDMGLDLLEQASETLDEQHEIASTTQTRNTRPLQLAFKLREQYESSLSDDIRSRETTSEQKIRAFRKLCRCGSVRSQALIFQQWNNDQLYRDVAVFAQRNSNSATIAQMVTATNDNELKLELMTELLNRNSDGSVRLFLNLTQEHRLYSLARQSGQQARRLPTQRLLTAVQSNRMGTVRAASITLSKGEDPRITHSLLRLTHNPSTVQARRPGQSVCGACVQRLAMVSNGGFGSAKMESFAGCQLN